MKFGRFVVPGPGDQTTSIAGNIRKLATAVIASGMLFGMALPFLLAPPAVEAQIQPICDSACGSADSTNSPSGIQAVADRSMQAHQRGLGTAASATIAAGNSAAIQGSQSYTYSVPLFSLPGRAGMDLTLTAYYNSHIWISDAVGAVFLGLDRDTPSPGFQLNFGFLEWNPGSNFPAGLLTSPDGAKHTLALDINNLVPNDSANNGFHCANLICLYNSDDSSYINVSRPLGTYDGSVCMGPNNCPAKDVTVTYKNGTKAIYQSFAVVTNDMWDELVMRPYRMEDTNGNFITINYVDVNDLAISSITDSLGRSINFFYNGATLSCVTDGPSCAASGARTYTFSWDPSHAINFNFGTSPVQAIFGTNLFNVQSGFHVPVVTAIARPDGSSVKFNYGDWGIVNDIQELSANGTVRYELSYNFPSLSAGALPGNPGYTQQQEAINGQINTWAYATNFDANGLIVSSVITDPAGMVATTTFARNGDVLDGLPIKIDSEDIHQEICNPSLCTPPVSLTRNLVWAGDLSVAAWFQKGIVQEGIPTGKNPRPVGITTIREDGSQTQVTLQYNDTGDVTRRLESDSGAAAPGPTLRETVTTYATLGNHILGLPTDVQVKDGSGKVVSHTTFAYDEGSIQSAGSPPAGHDTATQYSASNSTGRGNLTSSSVYSDPVGGTGAITSTFVYDMLGNKVNETDGCCTQTAWNYSIGTQYAYPDSVVQGPSGTQLTTSFTYFMNTGQLAAQTDWNGQVTTFSYDNSGRLIGIHKPDSVTWNTSYDDTSANPSVRQSNSANSLVTLHTTDFRGHALSDQALNGASLVSTRTYVNDSKGRPLQVSNPFGPGETPVYTSYVYDLLGRTVRTVPPALTSGGAQNPYTVSISGNTSIFTDPAGHQRKHYSNGLGQLVRVDEPGPAGGQAGAGLIAIAGTEQSASVPNGGGATAGTGSITISGSDRSTQVLTHNATAATGTVVINGIENSTTNTFDPCADQEPTEWNPNPSCPRTSTVWDSGTVSMTVNGLTKTVAYGQGATATASGLASGLAGAFGNTGTFTVTASGIVVTVTANSAGAGGNGITLSATSQTGDPSDFGSPSFGPQPSGPTLAGGSDNGYTTMYDTGTLTVTVNGFSRVSTYGQNTSTSAMATDLANKFNSDNTSPVIANVSGSVVNLTTKTTGFGTNYPLSATAATTSQYFTSGSSSFSGTPSGSAITPGQNGTVYDAGTVMVTISGFSTTPYAKSVNYSQGSTPSAIASGIAGALSGDNNSPVNAAISSNSSSTVLLTAKLQGANTNYGVVGSSATTQSSYFSQPSFTASASALTGGADQVFSLSTPVTTTAGYDPLGHQLQVTKGGQTRTYTYDGLGRMTSATAPETAGNPITYTYTDFGAIAQKTDPRVLPGTSTHVQTTFGYDGLNRLLSITYNDGTPNVTYVYNAPNSANNTGGRLASKSNGVETKAYQYDQMGRVLQRQETIGGGNYLVKYAYTADGQVGSITYPSQRVVNYTYDAIGRLSQLGTGTQTLLAVNSYNAAGLVLTTTYGNGVHGAFGFNNQLQTSSIAYSGANPLLSLAYSYGGSADNGQIQGITDNLNLARSISYQYDGVGRLKVAQTVDQTASGTWKLAYNYDIYGNRLDQIPVGGAGTMPPSYVAVDTASNRLLGGGAAYDSAGNMTGDGFNNYIFDAENRLTATSAANSLGGASATFGYGPNGDRVNKNGTYYIYSGGQPIAEYANGALAASPSAEYINLGGQQLASVVANAITYNYADHLSTRVSADSSGNPVRTYGHFPFGETWYETGTASKWKFTTYERDTESSGLDYAGARFHSTRLGRFASMDPIDSLNRYGYVENDPINAIDPSGMFSICIGNDCGPPCPYIFCIDPGGLGGGSNYCALCGEILGMPPGMKIPPITVDDMLRSILGIPDGSNDCEFGPCSDGGLGDFSGMGFASTSNPCDVPDHPPTANINNNIALAKKSRWLIFALPRLLWFYDQVRNKGPWDYKQQGRTRQDATGVDAVGTYVPSPYQDFGNFNFGATGAAAGIELQVLQRGAGWAQTRAGTSDPSWGHWYGSPSYGDDPADQAMILAGFNYYKYGCNK